MWSLGTAWKGSRGKDFDQNSVFIRLDTGERVDVDTPSHKFKEIILRDEESGHGGIIGVINTAFDFGVSVGARCK